MTDSKEIAERLREIRIPKRDYDGYVSIVTPPICEEAANLIDSQNKVIKEMSGLLSDLDQGRSIHNSRFPGQTIDGPLWAQIPRMVQSARTLTNKENADD